MSPHSKNYLIEKFRFRPHVASAEAGAMGPAEAKELVERYLERPIEYDPGHLLLNDDLIYVPYGWIGCSGFLVDRRTREVMLIGSSIVAFQAVWGYYRGISLAYERLERLQTLVIRVIHDARGTMRALRYPLWIYPRLHPFSRRLRRLPCVVDNLDLMWSIPELMKAEEANAFEFHVLPPNK